MLDKIMTIINENIFVEISVLKELGGSGLLTQVGLDSINIIYVIGQIEDEFNFTFAEEDLLLEKFETLDKIVDLIKKYVGE